MSDTPQTDVMVSNGASSYTWAESHRLLESRLTASQKECAELRRFWFEDAHPVETRFAAEYLEWRDARLEALGEKS